MKKKLSQIVILTALGFTTLASPAFSAEASYEQGIQETTQRLNHLEKEQRNAQAQLSGLTSKISETEKESKKLVTEIEKTTKQLDELKTEIEALNKAIAAREEKLQQQARAVQVGGEATNMVHFVLQAESFVDILGRVDVVSQIVGANKDLVQQQKEDIEAVVAKEKETELKQEEQMKLAAELESKKADLEQQKAEKEVLVASIAAEKAVVQNERSQFLAQKTAAENRVREMETARTAASQTSSRPVSSPAGSRSEAKKTSSKPAAPAPSVSGGSVINNAYSVIGSRYSYGGTTTSGFDCSGFTSYAFSKAGKSISRTASGQYASSAKISLSQAKPGDLVFFNQTGTIDHVGIYLGNGKFIGSQTSTGVAVASFTSGYWSRYLVGFGRVN